MKKLFLLMAATILASTVFAQTPIKYQGEVDLGYSIGTGTFAADRVNLHTIHGAKFGNHFSAGLGLGLDYYHEGEGEIIVPIYLNVKGYLPVSKKVSPYLSFDIGVGVGASEYVSGLSGLYFMPAIGIKAGHFKVQFGYNVQKLSEDGISVSFNAIQLRLGVAF